MNQIYKGVGRTVTTAASAVRKTVERGVKMGRQLAKQGARAARLGASRALRLARTAADMIPSPRRVAATCFVAGTLVLSAEGLVPIETIAVGDEVWSRDEASGEEAWQVVEETFITHPNELIYLEYEIANAEGGGPDYGELIGTAEHPFWVTNREAWVPMGELEIGNQLQLAHDGGEAIVTKLNVEIAPQGETFTTYNFAVSNWATYFVAPKNSPPNTAGIWVHNLGEKTCEQILQTLNTAIDAGKSKKVHQINKILSNAHAQGKLDPKVLAQAQEKIDAATKAGKISPATNRTASRFSKTTTPWQRTAYQRSDIDWDLVRPDGSRGAGLTNWQAARKGYAPGRYNPKSGKWEDSVLHHQLDDPRGTIIETWRSPHTSYHNRIKRGPNDFNELQGISDRPWRELRPDWADAWRREQAAYWRWRTGAYNPQPTTTLKLPGDP